MRALVWNVAAICLCLKAVMYISLRLGSDLEIRIQRKLCSDT